MAGKEIILSAYVGNLRAAVDIAARATETRTTIPVLSYLRVTRGYDSPVPSITGTDLDIEMQADIVEGSMVGGTEFLVPCAKLKKLLAGEASQASVTLTFDPVKATVTARIGRLTVELDSYPVEDFPIMVAMDKMAGPVVLNGATFNSFAKATIHSMSTEPTRYYLCGVLFGPDRMGDSAVLSMTSTDGHRLTHIATDAGYGDADPDGVLVPAKSMKLLEVLTRDGMDVVFMTQTKDATKAIFAGDRWQMVTKLIDGTFPDYTRVMPRIGFQCVATFDISIMREAAKKIAGLLDGKSNSVLLDLEADTLTAKSQYDSTRKVSMDVAPVMVKGGYDPFAVGMSVDYLAQALGILASFGTTATISIQSSADTFLLHVEGQSVQIVLMPMRV